MHNTQLELQLRHLWFRRMVQLFCEWAAVCLALFLLWYRFPSYMGAILALLTICIEITIWLDVAAIEDAVGVPHSRYLLWPIQRT